MFNRHQLPRFNQTEILDGTAWTRQELQGNLRDIRRVNRLGGGTRAVLRELPDLLHDISHEQYITILDLATGSGDIPIAIAGWAAKQNRKVRVIATDWSEAILDEARDQAQQHPAIEFYQFDAQAIPMIDQAVDVTLCSMALHHFEPDQAVQVLAEMRRVSRVGCLVNDLARSRVGYWAGFATSRLFTRNRLTRNDAPLSVLRAYTPDELAGLAARAGWVGAEVERRPLFRMIATWKRT